jgi:hypothetical protein
MIPRMVQVNAANRCVLSLGVPGVNPTRHVDLRSRIADHLAAKCDPDQ